MTAKSVLTSLSILSLIAATHAVQAQNDEFGKWITLFDGSSLDGWTKAKVDPPQSDDEPHGWVIDGGAMTNAQKNDICTKQEFENYELELWYRTGPNSGVYLRGQAEVQIFGSYGKPVAKMGQGDVGGIYSVSKPLANPQHPPGHWNQFRIRHIGNRATVYHNGFLVQDNVHVLQTPGRMTHSRVTRKELQPNRGPIMLQGDHDKIFYRNIRIRPLFAGDGWKSLWNGKDLAEFRSHQGLKVEDFWTVEKNSFTNTKTGHDGGKDLWTKGSYGNFLVHYEYRVDPKVEGGNSGFYMRDQWEVQILARQAHGKGGPAHSDGAVYSRKAAARGARHRGNGGRQWNQMDVKVEGQKMWVWQNGILIHDGVTEELKTRTDNHRVKTLEFTRGPFKLQGDHGKVWFTNLYIKELPDGAGREF